MLVSLYNGNVHVWSHESQVGVVSWEPILLVRLWIFFLASFLDAG